MNKLTFITIKGIEGLEADYAIIDRGNGEFTSMLKSTYEAKKAEQSTPIVINEAETI
jgi:hypothetical protein